MPPWHISLKLKSQNQVYIFLLLTDFILEISSDSASIQTLNSRSFQEFVKRNHGQYTVLFDFNAVQEDDISVQEGERVTVLNKDDSDWYWVQTCDGQEGFTPKEYLHYFSSMSQSGT